MTTKFPSTLVLMELAEELSAKNCELQLQWIRRDLNQEGPKASSLVATAALGEQKAAEVLSPRNLSCHLHSPSSRMPSHSLPRRLRLP